MAQLVQDFKRDAWMQRCLTRVNAPNRRDQFFRFRIFEQIAARARFDRRENFIVRDETRQRDDARFRLPRQNLPNRFDTIHLGHDEIHQDDIGLERVCLRDRGFAVARFADNLHICNLRQKCADAFADDAMIVYDEETDWFVQFVTL